MRAVNAGKWLWLGLFLTGAISVGSQVTAQEAGAVAAGLPKTGLPAPNKEDRSPQAPIETAIIHSLGDAKPVPWTSLQIDRSHREFQFAVVADNAGTPRPGIWREAMMKLNLLQPAFVMSVGDLIEGYVNTREQLNQQWDGFLSDLAPLQLPFFFVSGNHDVGRPLWYDVYRERIGPTWYYFIYQGVLMLVLDTNDGADHGTGMSDEQLAWVEAVLKKHPASSLRWTMVFQHKPLWNENNPQWNRIRKMLADRQKVTVLAGHIHNYQATQIDGVEYVALATTGGGSAMRGRDFGELDHVTWVTMKDDGPVFANLELSSILPIDFRTNQTSKLYEDFNNGKIVRAQPIAVESNEFQEGTTTATLRNPDSSPLRLQVLFDPPDGFVVQPASIHRILGPKEEATVSLRLKSEKPHDIASLQPVAIHWSAAYDLPGKPSLEWSTQSKWFVDGARQVKSITGPTIDGDLADWPELPYVVEQPGEIHSNAQAWRGVSDARYRFGVSCDQDNLFVAIEVVDDQIDHGGDMIWQDFAGVFVNPVVGPQAKPEQIKKEAFAVMAGLSMSEDDHARYAFGRPPQAVRTAAKQLDNRIQYEFAIPTQRFSELQNGQWSQLQLNIIVNDHDPADERLGISVMYWRPRWDGNAHYPTSGLFQR